MSLRATIGRLLNIWRTTVLCLRKRASRFGTWFYAHRLLKIMHSIFGRLSEFRLFATRPAHRIDVPSQAANSLASLPSELLTLILTELELRDLRRARSCCGSLYAASKSWTIWLGIFQRLSDSYVIPIIPPRPLASYSAAALESMVLQWSRVDHGWSSCSIRQQPPRQRIRCLEWEDTPFTLIEGGRWLLTTDQCGSVLAHDLDSSSLDMGTYVLIRPQNKRDHAFITSLSVCVDRSSPTLTFNLALSHDYSRRASKSSLSLWRITLVNSKLTSKFLKSFYTRVSESVFDTSLLHSLYARIVSPWAVEIFDWERSQSMFHVRSHVRPDGYMYSMRLLPGRRMLAGDRHSIHIYTIPKGAYHPATHAFVPLKTVEAQTPLQVIPVGDQFVTGGISPLYTSPSGRIYILLATCQHIFALSADTVGGQMSVIKVVDYAMRFRGTVYALGLHRTLIRQNYLPDSVITLNLLRDEQFDVAEHYWNDTIHCYSPTMLDEWSGRVVDCSKDGRIMVVDFVL